MDCIVRGVAKSWTQLSDFHFHLIEVLLVEILLKMFALRFFETMLDFLQIFKKLIFNYSSLNSVFMYHWACQKFIEIKLEIKGIAFLGLSFCWEDFLSFLEGKESACLAGDPGSVPELGRSPGESNGCPLQYSFWRIPWREEPGGYSPWGRKESDLTERISLLLRDHETEPEKTAFWRLFSVLSRTL